ncbi:MAG TPA: redoxin domain-containing protein, partial [Segetibacter sp.]
QLLRSLYNEFSKNVEFYGIIPGKAYTAGEVKKYARETEIPFSLALDKTKTLSNYLQATVTPQVILLDANNVLLYKGAIDDLLSQLGKQRLKPTREFLKEAILQSLRNERVFIKRTKAVGCRINDY